MEQKQPTKGGKRPETTRKARLKAALKANMAKRKAQARARTDSDPQSNEQE